jgi:hypothetical protein
MAGEAVFCIFLCSTSPLWDLEQSLMSIDVFGRVILLVKERNNQKEVFFMFAGKK